MKLIIGIIRDDFAGDVTRALNEAGLSVTRVSSTGGIWRRGNVTLLIGIQEAEVEKALRIIDENAGPEFEPELRESARPPSRAIIFLLDVSRFAHY